MLAISTTGAEPAGNPVQKRGELAERHGVELLQRDDRVEGRGREFEAGYISLYDSRAWSSSRTDRDDVPLGLHDPRAEARRTEAVLDPSAVGVVHEAAG